MKKAWVLSKLYINSLYGISSFINDLKTNRKAALKTVGLIVLIIFSLSGVVTMFVTINDKLYDAYKMINQQGIVITNSIIYASMFTLIFGILTVIATYFVNKEGDIILAMPFKPWNLLFAKFVTNYIAQFLIGLVILGTGFIVYGVRSGAGATFYIMYILIALVTPVLPLVISYLVLIPVMKAGNILKKKDAVMIFSGFIGIGFGVGFQVYLQSIAGSMNNLEILRSKFGLVEATGRAYYPSIWGTHAALNSFFPEGILYFLLFLAVSLAAVLLLLNLMSGLYIQSIIGSEEVRKTNKKYSDAELKSSFKGNSKFSALLKREIKLMNREPIYFINGPMIILLLPLIFGVMFAVQKGSISKVLDQLLILPNAIFYITLAMAAFSVFLGVSTNIVATSISREGKTFMHLKSMPIEPGEYIKAKIAHGILFGVLGMVVVSLIGAIFLKMPAVNILIAFAVSMCIMIPMLIGEMFLDLTWPKLVWDSPQKAMKQNVNAVFSVLGSFFILPVLGLFVVYVLKTPLYSYLALTIIPAAAGILSYRALIKYCGKRFYDIEV